MVLKCIGFVLCAIKLYVFTNICFNLWTLSHRPLKGKVHENKTEVSLLLLLLE